MSLQNRSDSFVFVGFFCFVLFIYLIFYYFLGGGVKNWIFFLIKAHNNEYSCPIIISGERRWARNAITIESNRFQSVETISWNFDEVNLQNAIYA